MLGTNFLADLQNHSDPEEETAIITPNNNQYKLAIETVTDTTLK